MPLASFASFTLKPGAPCSALTHPSPQLLFWRCHLLTAPHPHTDICESFLFFNTNFNATSPVKCSPPPQPGLSPSSELSEHFIHISHMASLSFYLILR